MSSRIRRHPAIISVCAVSVVALAAFVTNARAQEADVSAQADPIEAPGATLPAVEVVQKKKSPSSTQKARKPRVAAKEGQQSISAGSPVPMAPDEDANQAAMSDGPRQASGIPAQRSGSLSVPTVAEARAEIQQTPGAVEVVAGSEFQRSTPAVTIKDALNYVPGVFVQPKWGDDTRLSIRGSSLSRNFHLRSIQLYMDGIPINTSDGYGDFQEIDPSAYRYLEVYKGGNALRFGANSLGGAINFVMPTGYDADLFGARVDIGSFGFHKLSASSGAVSGPVDYFMAGTWQEADGFRQHSDGHSVRGSFNIGYRLSSDVETRFYVNANEVRQRIPGSVSRESALTTPETAAANNVSGDWQRNIDTVRIANKTAVRMAPGTLLEFGAFYVDRHLMHPIYEWLDYQYNDYGGFARLTDTSRIAGHENRLVVGANLLNGAIDTRQYQNIGGKKGNLTTDSNDLAQNFSAYIEDHFYILPSVALVGGTQFLHATRTRHDLFLSNGDQSGRTEFNLWSPKGGILWNLDRSSQVFANISRSAEVPSFGESISGMAGPVTPFTEIRAQRATTYEIGTRGDYEDYSWDFTAYRAEIKNELQCLYSAFGNCNVSNADRTVHQGLEIGGSAVLAKGIFAKGYTPDKLWLRAAYTLNDFYFDNDAKFGNNTLPGAPRHMLNAELLYKHPSGVYFGPTTEVVPEAYFADSANTLTTSAYAIWGLKLGFDNNGPITAYIEGRNLSDEAYIASTSIIDRAKYDSPLFEPGTGRAVYAGVQVKW
ncbi:TonB-dependent receptor [Hyphomicrobium methylovorum]|uniref:TonB-dependent receptor family protein n=1 Tax=Hyphomicrobium methylovorum TaxID=84 RepID=UPI0015E74CD6|nr:TonB-dependent receptor [Hyphomicrobium methylovorum]MBA2125411.1 TonB-dependent receptor [Hyphomicrobium methylovorum]